MSGRGRRRPAGQVRERDRDRVLEVVGQTAEPGAEDDPDLGDEVVRARTAATSAARRAGCSAGGIGRVGSTSGVEWVIGASSTHRTRRPGPVDFAGPTGVSTPGCRSRPVGRSSPATVVRRRRRGNEAPEATGGGAEVLDAISGPSILSAPSGKTYVTGRPPGRVNAVIHELAGSGRSGIHELSAAVDRLWRTAPSAAHREHLDLRQASTSPRSGARSSGRRGAARSPRSRRPGPRPTRPERRTARRSWPSTANRQV